MITRRFFERKRNNSRLFLSLSLSLFALFAVLTYKDGIFGDVNIGLKRSMYSETRPFHQFSCFLPRLRRCTITVLENFEEDRRPEINRYSIKLLASARYCRCRVVPVRPRRRSHLRFNRERAIDAFVTYF